MRPDEEPPSDVVRLIGLATQILAPITVLTAALYYFGFVRYQEFFGYFGVDLASAGLSRTGYLIGSARVAFRPLALAMLVSLGALAAHHVLTLWLPRADARAKRALLLGVAGCTALLLTAAIAGLLEVTALGSPVVPPLSLAGAALLAGYTAHLADRADLPPPLKETLAQTRMPRLVILSGTVLVALFWVVSNYAQERGIVAAKAFEQSLPAQSRAVIYSREPLVISGPGVVVAKLPGPARYAYRYSGLRVLAHSHDRWLLVPAGWNRTDSTVIILPDMADDMRVDLAP